MFHVEHWVGGVKFHGFDDAVVGAAGDDAEAVAGGGYGLVVAGVDGEAEEAVGFGRLGGGEERGEETAGGDERAVGDGYAGAGFVIYREGGEVLDEGAAAPDVERLEAVTDAEDGLGVFRGVVEEEIVGCLAGGIGGGGGWVAVGAVEGWVNVGGAAWQENAVAGSGEGVDLGRRGGDVDGDGLATGAGDGGRVGGPGALVVDEIRRGGLRNGDAWLHRRLLIRRVPQDGCGEEAEVC